MPPPSSGVSPTAVPPLHKFEGTHGVRSAWGNTDAIDFVAIASSLQATNGIQGVCNTNRLKAVPLVHGRKNLHSLVHLYKASRSTLAFSPPCGSRSIFENISIIVKTYVAVPTFHRCVLCILSALCSLRNE